MSDSKSSYRQILKSSSIMGGAAGISMLLGMIRTKFAAVLIGTTGVGLVASFGAVQGIIGTLAGLGIQSSGVRDIAAAVAKNDEQAIGRSVLTLRRVCWVTGLFGFIGMVALSPWISQLTFSTKEYTLDIASLGLVILFGNLTGGQLAYIQGMRRIADMARANIIGNALGTMTTVGFYLWLGLRGIVPALIVLSITQFCIAWHYAKRIQAPVVYLSWRQTLKEARGLVRLGAVFMWTGLMGSAVSYGAVTFIAQTTGLEAVGIYSAAFALSGVFVGFVLGAMGADYYPRLAGVADDHSAMNKLVNEQTEIGLLMAMPGLVATAVLAPWVVHALYSSLFIPSVELLRWFLLGCLGRVISWPLGYVLLAKGDAKWLLITETGFNALHMLLIVVLMKIFGLVGVAVAFVILYVAHISAVYLIARRLTGFGWASSTWQGAAVSIVSLVLISVAQSVISGAWLVIVNVLAVLFCVSVCLVQLLLKIRYENKFINKIGNSTAMKFLAGAFGGGK